MTVKKRTIAAASTVALMAGGGAALLVGPASAQSPYCNLPAGTPSVELPAPFYCIPIIPTTPTTTTPTTTTPEPTPAKLPSTKANNKKVSNAIAKQLRKKKYGSQLRRTKKAVRITVKGARPGKYTVTVTRKGRKGSIIKGSKTIKGSTTKTLRLNLRSTASGRKYLRRIKSKRITLRVKLVYRTTSGKSKRTTTKNVKVRIR